MRIRPKSLIPLLAVIGAWLASPEALALVPEKWAHILIAVSSLIAVLTPALLTNRPPTPKRIPARDSASARIGDVSDVAIVPLAGAEHIPPLAAIPAKERGET